jgi:hypothetical protein
MIDMKKEAVKLATTGITIGVIGGVPYAGPALKPLSDMLPVVGSITGAGMVVKGLKKLTK